MNTTPPTVGTHGSYNVGSDTHPCTVVSVSPSGHQVTVEEDDVTRWSPFPESEGLEFARREGGPSRLFTRRADGSYREVGSHGGYLHLGGWRAHRNPSF